MTMPETSRSPYVDTLRGIACLLLVFFHVVGDTPAAGLTLPESHWLHQLNGAILYLRMPLFAFIAGYVYAYRPYRGQFTKFLSGKALRLLLPVLTVGTAFAVLQANVSSSNNEVGVWWKLHWIPVAHYWFLQSLFIVFVVIALLEHLKALQTPLRTLGVWLVSLVLVLTWVPPPQLGLPGAVFLLPFFIGGLASTRFEFSRRVWVSLAAAVLAVSIVGVIFSDEGASTEGLGLAVVGLGLSAAFLLQQSHLKNRVLAFIGAYSFAIYLFHVFFTASSRMVLKRLGVVDIAPLLLSGIAVGVIGPVVLAMVIRRYRVLNLLLLGGSFKTKQAQAARNRANTAVPARS